MINKTLVSVLVIAISVTLIVSVNARATRPLTDAEMNTIFGGCGLTCEHKSGACADIEYEGDCSAADPNWPGGQGGCDGSYDTSCNQAKGRCVEYTGHGWRTCPNCILDCWGTYMHWYCSNTGGECEFYSDGPYECKDRTPGTKDWCMTVVH